MSESTNRLSIDADQQVPRVIKRGTVSGSPTYEAGNWGIYLYSAGLGYVTDTFDNTTNSWVEAWLEFEGKLYELPFATVNSTSGEIDLAGGVGVSAVSINGKNSNQLAFYISRSGLYGSVSDVFTVHYIYYSTKVTEDRLV